MSYSFVVVVLSLWGSKADLHYSSLRKKRGTKRELTLTIREICKWGDWKSIKTRARSLKEQKEISIRTREHIDCIQMSLKDMWRLYKWGSVYYGTNSLLGIIMGFGYKRFSGHLLIFHFFGFESLFCIVWMLILYRHHAVEVFVIESL